MYSALRPVRRECVHGVARQAGIVRQALADSKGWFRTSRGAGVLWLVAQFPALLAACTAPA